MESKKFKASCPICGRNLFRAVPNSYMEGNCPKCGSFLMISFGSDGITVQTNPVDSETYCKK